MYKDTNRKILEEINSLGYLERGKIVGRNMHCTTSVTSLGSFYSKTLEKDLHIGLKEYKSSVGGGIDFLVALELGLVDKIEQEIPYVLEEFPLFHGICIGKEGETIGVITEDFSKSGLYSVNSIN